MDLVVLPSESSVSVYLPSRCLDLRVLDERVNFLAGSCLTGVAELFESLVLLTIFCLVGVFSVVLILLMLDSLSLSESVVDESVVEVLDDGMIAFDIGACCFWGGRGFLRGRPRPRDCWGFEFVGGFVLFVLLVEERRSFFWGLTSSDSELLADKSSPFFFASFFDDLRFDCAECFC